MQRIISPSMLSADFGHLERDTQMVDRRTGRIKRITNHKYPYEYLDRFNDILENKREIFGFFV